MADVDNLDIDIYGDIENEVNAAARPQDRNEERRIASEANTVEEKNFGMHANSIDPLATTALYVADLNWWTTEDELRGWIRDADSESGLKEITFSEHKVNGKSKGVAFIEFTDTVSASKVKAAIEVMSASPGVSKKYQVNFTSTHTNPFRTLPKDTPKGRLEPRKDAQERTQTGSLVNPLGTYHGPVPNRGRGSTFASHPRSMGYYHNSRVSIPHQMSVPLPSAQSHSNQMAAFQSQNMPMLQFGGGYLSQQPIPGRGSITATRGGRAPMNTSGMAMMSQRVPVQEHYPMGQFNPMIGSTGNFTATHFNPSFFSPPNSIAHSQWENSHNPHGTKRPRPNE